MANTQVSPDYHEIAKLSNSELGKRTKMALERFIRTVTQGGNVAETAQLYNAYEDERLKRLNITNLTSSIGGNHPSPKKC